VTGTGALVDVDGTLVDSNYHHTIAWSRALRDHGCNARLAAIHRLVGMGSSQLLETLIGRSDDKIAESWRTHFDELLPEVLVLDRAAELLRSMHDRGLTVVLATSSPEDLLDVSLAKADLARDRTVVLGDSVWDAKASARARLPCVALETGGFSRPELESEGVVAVYRDPGDLLDQFDDSPIGKLAGS